MTPEQALHTIGLSEKETRVYLSCLELGQDSITHIAKKSGIKRPTVYLILESLQARGLLNTSTRGKRTVFGVEEPNKLISFIAERERNLKTVLPFLEALNNRKPSKPKIRFYEGREGLMRVYEEMFEAQEMRFWGSVGNTQKHFPDVVSWFIKISHSKKPKTFDILADTPEDRAYAKRVIRPGYQIRFFPKEALLETDSMLAGNKLSISAFSPDPHGLIIESESIARSFKLLWELAWMSAVSYEKIMRKK
jgi:sugar-specific transcriptional regulator TrmB